MKVEPEFREDTVEYFRMALNMCKIGVTYQQADLVDVIYKELQKKKGNFTVMDGMRLMNERKKYWSEIEKQEKEKVKQYNWPVEKLDCVMCEYAVSIGMTKCGFHEHQDTQLQKFISGNTKNK
jgi:hypothetical protein